jgi:hypothetical protein
MPPTTDEEMELDAKLLALMHRELNASKWRFKAKVLCEELNCSLEELLAAFDRLLCAGCVSAVGPTPPKHGHADG